MSNSLHQPVLLNESVEYLRAASGKKIIDGTFGFGGHSKVILQKGAEVLGIDLDIHAVNACKVLAEENDRLACFHGSFREIKKAITEQGWENCDGILLDLGVSSYQLDDPTKGFTYRQDTNLDMRFNQTTGRTAADILAESSEGELADIIYQYGEERKSRRIARAIVNTRTEDGISTTKQLKDCVESAIGKGPTLNASLSRVFQAIRIAVNDELSSLSDTLVDAVDALAPKGRLVVISYHSLEDRIVKKYFALESTGCICPSEFPECRCSHQASIKLVTRKPVVAHDDELTTNPRSRSAKLRVVEKK
jgi:16S rRNA (cytosine1402-N4)-methyltransferase